MQYESFRRLRHRGLYKQQPAPLARKYARIFVRGHCLFREVRTVFWVRSSRKSVSFEEQIKSNENIRAYFQSHNGDYSVYYPPNIFRNMSSFENWGYSRFFPRFSRKYMMDWWIIVMLTKLFRWVKSHTRSLGDKFLVIHILPFFEHDNLVNIKTCSGQDYRAVGYLRTFAPKISHVEIFLNFDCN